VRVLEPAGAADLAGLAAVAASRLDPVHRDFFAGGAGDERTLRANTDAFDAARVLPRVLRAPGPRDLAVRVLGQDLSSPVLVAPTAFHRLAHPEGEVATARAVAAAGTVLVLSMASTRTVEDVAATGAALWFQLYPQPDAAFTEALVRRAEAAGCRALVVTVDSPVFVHRPRDRRNGFVDLPPGLACENLRVDGRPRPIVMDDTLGWDAVARLRALTRLPLVLKGVLHPADARLAVEHGVDAVWVSNHGGRQLDGAVATLDALPGVVAAVGGRLPVLLDGGVRRGVDVLVALALGATAVGIGRPALWGLAAAGDAGVASVLALLAAELDAALALAGAARPAGLTRDLVVPR
jgi:4-hydroxymandelate oxidase